MWIIEVFKVKEDTPVYWGGGNKFVKKECDAKKFYSKIIAKYTRALISQEYKGQLSLSKLVWAETPLWELPDGLKTEGEKQRYQLPIFGNVRDRQLEALGCTDFKDLDCPGHNGFKTQSFLATKEVADFIQKKIVLPLLTPLETRK